MSLRRSIEYHFKECLTPYLLADHPTFTVIESLRQEERPVPCILVVAGQAEPAFASDLPDSGMNWMVNVSVLVMSTVDKDTVDNHSDVAIAAWSCMRLRDNRKRSRILGLHLYEIEDGSQGEDNEGRQMGSGLNFKVVCNYDPTAYIPPVIPPTTP